MIILSGMVMAVLLCYQQGRAEQHMREKYAGLESKLAELQRIMPPRAPALSNLPPSIPNIFLLAHQVGVFVQSFKSLSPNTVQLEMIGNYQQQLNFIFLLNTQSQVIVLADFLFREKEKVILHLIIFPQFLPRQESKTTHYILNSPMCNQPYEVIKLQQPPFFRGGELVGEIKSKKKYWQIVKSVTNEFYVTRKEVP